MLDAQWDSQRFAQQTLLSNLNFCGIHHFFKTVKRGVVLLFSKKIYKHRQSCWGKGVRWRRWPAAGHEFIENFCAGENPDGARRNALELWDNGLRSMLDYGLENAVDNESCDRNLDGFHQTVESTKSLPKSSVKQKLNFF